MAKGSAGARNSVLRTLALTVRGQRVKVYPTYAAAAAACRNSYGDAQLAEVVAAKTQAFAQELRRAQFPLDVGSLRALLAVVNDDGGRIRVIDLGGAAGYHYFVARQLLPPETHLSWHVVETPTMVEASRPLESDELRFFSSFDEALAPWSDAPHAAFASGVLQCVPDPLGMAGQLASSGAHSIVITRTAFSIDSTTKAIVQSSTLSANGPGPLPTGVRDAPVEFPTILVPVQGVTDVFDHGYTLVAQFTEDPCAYMVDGDCIPTRGFVYRHR